MTNPYSDRFPKRVWVCVICSLVTCVLVCRRSSQNKNRILPGSVGEFCNSMLWKDDIRAFDLMNPSDSDDRGLKQVLVVSLCNIWCLLHVKHRKLLSQLSLTTGLVSMQQFYLWPQNVTCEVHMNLYFKWTGVKSTTNSIPTHIMMKSAVVG